MFGKSPVAVGVSAPPLAGPLRNAHPVATAAITTTKETYPETEVPLWLRLLPPGLVPMQVALERLF